MDIFEYRTSRSFNTQGVFISNTVDSEISGLFVRLKNLMVSELHLQWDIAFLEQYTKEQMVPRGLRWDIYPQQGELDVDLWYKYFNESGLKLISFLVERKQVRLSLLDKEIREIRDKLTPSSGNPEYISLSTGLKTHLEKEEKDQRSKKQKKYNRDVSDYATQLVFNWQKKMASNNNSAENPPAMETSSSVGAIPDRRLVFQPPIPTPPHIATAQYSSTNGGRKKNLAPPNREGGRGRHPQPNRGRGLPHRGGGQGYVDRSRTYSNVPQRGWYDNRGGHNGEGSTYHTPTRNQGYPILSKGERTYDSHYEPYSYSSRNDSDEYYRTPYDYHQEVPSQSQDQGFHRPTPHTPRNLRPNEVAEGGGAYSAKRKREK